MFGKSVEVSVVNGQCFEEIPAFWQRCEAKEITLKIAQAAGLGKEDMLSSIMYEHDPKGTFRYMICADVPAADVPEGFEWLDVPAHTWAVFTTEASADVTDALQDIFKRIHPEWFPSSGYEHAVGPDQERYRRVGNGEFVAEAWIPIVKK